MQARVSAVAGFASAARSAARARPTGPSGRQRRRKADDTIAPGSDVAFRRPDTVTRGSTRSLCAAGAAACTSAASESAVTFVFCNSPSSAARRVQFRTRLISVSEAAWFHALARSASWLRRTTSAPSPPTERWSGSRSA